MSMRKLIIGIVMALLIGGGALYVGTLLAERGGAAVEGVASPSAPATSAVLRTVEMTARQWAFEPSEVRVRIGERVRFIVKNIDVAHGIAIPELGVNEILPAGTTRTVEFIASKPGSFPFLCSIYCGAGHNAMRGTLVVE